MNFEFATAGRVVFGPGCLSAALMDAPRHGTRALVVSGSRTERAEPLVARLTELGVPSQVHGVSGEPSVSTALELVTRGRDFGADLIVGFGGGSALDAAKAVALLLANPGDPLDYLEVVGRGLPITAPALPCIAIPTTAGTGSEVTRNAVLASTEHRVKVSLRDASMLPRLAIVDSQLTLSVPRATTAATGLDALTQCIEPYLSCAANPLTDGIALEGMRHAARCLRRAYADGSDLEARTGMALASLFGGLSLANAKLGAVHGFAGPIGGMCDAPHGAVCARLLPLVFATNLTALRQRQPENPALARMQRVAQVLLDDSNAAADAAIEWLEALIDDLGIPGLAQYGLTQAELPDLVQKAQRASSMKGNPLPLTPDELHSLATKALEPPSSSARN